MKDDKRKKKIILMSSILGAIVLLLGATYAWITLTIVGTKKVSLAAGKLELILDESTTQNLSLTNAVPMYDTDGIKGSAFEFKLINKSTVPVDFSIYLDNDEELLADCNAKNGTCNLLEDKDIRYQIEENAFSDIRSLSDGRMISTGTIKGGDTYTYTLKLWINIDATNEASGKYFFGHIRVDAEQNPNDITEDTSGANAPVLASNMIPVTYNGYSWIKASNDSTWYNYGRQIWANAVTVTEGTRTAYQNAPDGTKISMDDILQMFVWIPRYSYTIKSEDGTNYYGKQETGREDAPTKLLPGEIDVKFVSTTTKDTGSAQYKKGEEPGNWYTPPGFTFGDEELPGIWVGKFESGTTNNTSPGDVVTNNILAIKPNITSWRSIRVSTLDLVSRGVVANGNIYGFDSTYDSHAMKNSEWATVSYLTQSKYGKYGNSMYTGANKEIYMNNYNGYRTGCSSGVPSASSSSTCEASYDVILDQGNGLGAKGAGASTTGNIYGIYDMNGGAWEYMMGSYNKYSGYTSKSYTVQQAQDELGKTITSDVGTWNSGYTGTCGFDGKQFIGREWPEEKYYDLYTTSSTATACGGSACKGHALNEVAGWYSDSSNVVYENAPWSIRGGSHATGVGPTGVFCYNNYYGNAYGHESFRLVLAP